MQVSLAFLPRVYLGACVRLMLEFGERKKKYSPRILPTNLSCQRLCTQKECVGSDVLRGTAMLLTQECSLVWHLKVHGWWRYSEVKTRVHYTNYEKLKGITHNEKNHHKYNYSLLRSKWERQREFEIEKKKKEPEWEKWQKRYSWESLTVGAKNERVTGSFRKRKTGRRSCLGRQSQNSIDRERIGD